MFESELEIVDVNHNHDIRDQGRAFRMTVLNTTINSMHKTILYISRQLLRYFLQEFRFLQQQKELSTLHTDHIYYTNCQDIPSHCT